MTFEECCLECIKNETLVKEFNRLTGNTLGVKRTNIQKIIDDSCNYDPDKAALPDFCQFVYTFIWAPLVC